MPGPKEIVFVEVESQMSGVEFTTLYLIQHLDRSKWIPLVVCPEEGDLPSKCRATGVPVAIVPRPHLFSTSSYIGGVAVLNPFALIADLGLLILSAFLLARLLRVRRPALVVPKGLMAQIYGGLAARLVGIPCVWHVQDRVSNRAGPFFAWTLSLAGRWLAKEIIVDAASIARQLRSFVPSERIWVIWNGVDTQEFSPSVDGSGVRAEWGVRNGELLIGSTGRLTPWKGQRVLIQAFALIANQFPQARVALIGAALFETNEYESVLKRETARLGLGDRVIFAGFRRDLPQVLAALDVIAHTALEKDSSPLAVVSAMAVGKPIVCTRVDGTVELFEDGVSGLLVPPGDVDALAGALERLASNVTLREKLGRAAREEAECKLSIEQFAADCQAVFDRALR